MGDFEFENPQLEVDENQHSEDDTETILMPTQDEDLYEYYKAETTQAATSTSVVDSSQAEKTLSVKDTGIKSFAVPDDTIPLFKQIRTLTNALEVRRLATHLNFDPSINPIMIFIEKCTRRNKPFKKERKQLIINDAAVYRVLTKLLQNSAGYQDLLKLKDLIWACDLFKKFLMRTGFCSSIHDIVPRPTNRVAGEIAKYFKYLVMSVQFNQATELISINLDAYCAEKRDVLEFLMQNPATMLPSLMAIQELLAGLPTVFQNDFIRHLRNQKLELKETFNEVIDDIIEYQNTNRCTFDSVKSSTGEFYTDSSNRFFANVPTIEPSVGNNVSNNLNINSAPIQVVANSSVSAPSNVANIADAPKKNRRKEGAKFNNNASFRRKIPIVAPFRGTSHRAPFVANTRRDNIPTAPNRFHNSNAPPRGNYPNRQWNNNHSQQPRQNGYQGNNNNRSFDGQWGQASKNLATQHRNRFDANNIYGHGHVTFACNVIPTAQDDVMFHIDSAATHSHVISSEGLSDIIPDVRIEIATAGGQRHFTTCLGYIGNIAFLVTPTFQFNLLSVQELTKFGWSVNFNAKECTIIDEDLKLIVLSCPFINKTSYSIARRVLIRMLEVYWNHRLHIKNGSKLNKQMNLAMVVNPGPTRTEKNEDKAVHTCSSCQQEFIKDRNVSQYLMLHSRTHKPLKLLQELARNGHVRGITQIEFTLTDKKLPPCLYCIQTGLKSRSFSHDSNRKPNRPFEVIHADLKGPITPLGINSERYMLGIVDTYSKYTTIYFLTSKDQTYMHIENYIKTTVSEVTKIWSGTNPSNSILNIHLMLGTIITDQGGEFTSQNLKQVCSNFGVMLKVTPAYTPQLNGQIETKWSAIMHGTRKWLMQANIATKYWPYAARHEVSLQNTTSLVKIVLPHLIKKATPFELLFKQKPSLSYLRQFGCDVHVFIHEEQRINPNFSNRSYEGTLLGFADHPVSHSAIIVTNDSINSIKPTINYVDRDNCVYNELLVTSYNSFNGEKVVSADIPDDDSSEPKENVNIISTSNYANTATRISNNNKRKSHELDLNTNLRTMNEKLTDDINDIPFNIAINGPKRLQWLDAMSAEYKSIDLNKVWTLCERPFNKKILKTRWVLRIKITDEMKEKLKARLVVLGYLAVDGIDFESLFIFAPVAKMSSFRIFISIVTQYRMFVVQVDVETAFQNAILDDDIYIEIPPMYVELTESDISIFNNPVLKLNKALYGLPQAPKAWFRTIDTVLKDIGYTALNNEPCLYKRTTHDGLLVAITVLYVDDLLIANTSQVELHSIINELSNRFKLKITWDIKRILGVNVKFNINTGITLVHQQDKIDELERILDIDENNLVKLPKTPIDQHINWFKPDKNDNSKPLSEEQASVFRSLLGKVMYLMTSTRPDVCFSVSLLSRFAKNPFDKHLYAIKHLVKYLINTKNLYLTFKRHHPVNYKLLAFSDADWATENVTRRSQSGGIIMLGGTPIVWISVQQTTVALSSTEAELNALREVTKQVLWTRNVMSELGILRQQVVPIFEDNSSAILLVHNPNVNSVNRHTDISHKFITENILQFKTISVNFIPSQLNLADLFTKLVKEPLFSKLINSLFNLYKNPNGVNNI